ncbi:MAG: glutathione S-transferase family protein [Pseudomonadales bacterium]|nr:glutathione S-transferase family protein [Pseudomonadales bacterium]
MSSITLWMAPGTCARVTAISLEEAELEFDTELIRFMKGQHKSPEYRTVNPKGKVPALVIDGEALTENLAILTYLNERYPEANLLPPARDSMTRARQLADLSFCAATLHPIATRIRIPTFFASKEAAKSVWESACGAMDEYFRLIEDRLDGKPWWYGDNWSVMDAYLYWIYWRVEGAGYAVGDFNNYQAHKSRMENRPAVQRALARENEALAQLEKEGLVFTPSKPD